MKNVMKKMVMVLLMVAVVFSMVSCEKPPADGAAKSAGGKIVLKLGHGNGSSEEDMINMYAHEFERLLEEYSAGAIDVQVYPSSQLGDEFEMYGALGLNTLEATIGASTNYVTYAPILNFTVLPYMFDTLDECRLFFAENIDYMNSFVIPQANSRILGHPVGGMRSLASNTKVESMADVKGLKVRVPPTKPMLAFWEAVGASPQVVAWAETYTALEQGVAEGVCGNEWILIDNKFGEVNDYFNYVEYMPQPNCFAMSEDFYQSLTPELQEAVTKAGAESTQFFLDLTDEGRAKYRKLAEDTNGVVFIDPPSDIETWREKGRSTWTAAYKDIGNGDAEAGKKIVDYVANYGK